MPERIDLSRADDPRDVVHRAVACLAQGGVIGLPTESSYGVVAGVLDLRAVGRVRALADNGPAPLGRRPTLLLKSSGEVDDWADVSSDSGRRLALRGWPGPLSMLLPVPSTSLTHRLPEPSRSLLVVGGTIALRVPSDRMTREILRLTPAPLILVEAFDHPDGPVATADDLAALADLDMVLDAGATRHRGPSTVVALDGEAWSVVRPGVLPDRTLSQMAGTIFLFVCTGNTCRSPMAEALCKTLLARRLGCEPDDLVDRGILVFSAGVSAMDGMPAASHAVEVVRSRGGSLEDHASQRASPELVRHADHVIAMTGDHLDVLLDHIPEVAPRARLLDAQGDDIDDPVGSDYATYLRTARAIEAHLDRLLDELGYPS